MYLKSIELVGFKSFGRKSRFEFHTPVTGIVGPNGSGKSNVAEAFRFVLGEQSMKSLRGKRGEDLIFSGTSDAPRSNRASVKVSFDNTKRLLDIDFDEVIIERVVHRDGVNEYLINGSKVRLKDVIELLAGANIGASGHHIISQGEADRILLANPQERREVIEDALGLRVFQYKKQESLRKLDRTLENKKQVESLRKENAPHLRFLTRQVEKIEKALTIREALTEKYKEYLKRESVYLDQEERRIADEWKGPTQELQDLEDRLASLKQTIAEAKPDGDSKELLSLESELSEVRRQQETLARELGRLEGQMMFEERRKEDEQRRRDGQMIPLSTAGEYVEDVDAQLTTAEQEEDITKVREIIQHVRKTLRSLLEVHRTETTDEVTRSTLSGLEEEKQKLTEKNETLEAERKRLETTYQELRKKIENVKDESRDAEREMFEVMTRQNELRVVLNELNRKRETLERDREEFRRELGEAGALIGRAALDYEVFPIGDESSIENEDRAVQVERRRELEKMKIRLEELGGGSADEIMKEFKEVRERDEFLQKEIADLEHSIESLRQLIAELETELDTRFKEGMNKINEQFQNFFALMFGGGNASLMLVSAPKKKRSIDLELGGDPDEEEEEGQEGIDIAVSLPRKRIKGLVMLSGGERALTSIALIFAMSQVNPPPFLILDETDAALDEANSRRYGDMIENLAKKSQLILITHNRETMSRAGVLYGVTMGSDGISKTLSVKFAEAVEVAK